jgi:lysophospholipid acyltransferase (LPLAT)-like uncharacterized protein
VRDQATHGAIQDAGTRTIGSRATGITPRRESVFGPIRRAGVLLVTAYLRAVRPTLRVHRLGRIGRHPTPEAVVYAALHGDQIVLVGSHEDGVVTLVSHSADGESASRVLAAFGHQAVRGSSSRGSVAGFLSLRRRLRSGASVLITVDGPRGPRGSVAPGVAALAAATGAPLVPVVAACRPALRLRSWDAMQIPLPFARILVLYGRVIDPAGPRAGVVDRVGRSLARLRGRAHRLLGAP